MTVLVKVRGESAYEHVLDLDKNPWARERIATGSLQIVEELDGLPADPWAEQAPRRGRKAKAAETQPAPEPEPKSDADVKPVASEPEGGA